MKAEIIKKEKILEDLIRGLNLPPMGKFTQMYEQKPVQEQEARELVEILEKEKKAQSEQVLSDKVKIAAMGEKYAIGIRDISIDEYGGSCGLTYKVAFQVIDIKTKKVIYEFGPEVYRDGKCRESDNWEIGYKEAKILEEKDGELIIGLKSRDKIAIKRISKEGSVENLEEYDLNPSKDVECVSRYAEGISTLDDSDLALLLEAKYLNRYTKRKMEGRANVQQITDNIALGAVIYGAGSSSWKSTAQLCLVIKDQGIVELGETKIQMYEYSESYMRSKHFEKCKIKAKNGKVYIAGELVTYLIGDRISEVDRKPFAYELDLELPGVELGKARLESLIEEHEQQWVKNNKTFPVGLTETQGPTALPYSIDYVVKEDKAIVAVTEIIDAEGFHKRTTGPYRYIVPDMELEVSFYEVSGLLTENPTIQRIGSYLTPEDERVDYVIGARLKNDKLTFCQKPKLKLTEEGAELEVEIMKEGGTIDSRKFEVKI